MKFGKTYVQFSKIMVLMVLAAVTVMAAVCLAGMIRLSDFAQTASLFGRYTDFASVVFVAYSGNSVAEKWLSSGGKGDGKPDAAGKDEAEG